MLRKSSFFASLTYNQRESLLRVMQEKSFAQEEEVFHQGDVGDAFYIICSGSAKVVQEDPSGAENELTTLGQNEYFGERALMYDEARAATVRAESKLSTVSITRQVPRLQELRSRV